MLESCFRNGLGHARGHSIVDIGGERSEAVERHVTLCSHDLDLLRIEMNKRVEDICAGVNDVNAYESPFGQSGGEASQSNSAKKVRAWVRVLNSTSKSS